MSVKSLSILLCASVLVGFVVGKHKINGASSSLLNGQGNIDELIESKEVRRPVRQYSQYDYDEYAAQNGYGSQGSRGANGYNTRQQDGYDGYGEQNKNNGFISGRVRPGETVSIGNGVGRTSVVAINSGSDADTYVGYTDGKVSHGYDQSVYPNGGSQAGILKNPGEDVLLWSTKGNKQSGIKVDNDGVQLYSGNGYEGVYQNAYNQQAAFNQGGNNRRPVGKNNYQSSSYNYQQQQQAYYNSQGSY